MRARYTLFLFFLCFLSTCNCLNKDPIPCNVSSSASSSSCIAALYYVPDKPKTIKETTALFGVPASAVGVTDNGFLVTVTCSCLADHQQFIWHTNYKVQTGDTWNLLSEKFGMMVVEKQDKQLITSMDVMLDILCGCVTGFELVTYNIKPGDTLYTISLKFKVDMEEIRRFNNITHDSSLIFAGDNIFIPTSENNISRLIVHDEKEDEEPNKNVEKRTSKLKKHVVLMISLAVGVIFVSISTIFWVYYKKRQRQEQKINNSRQSSLSSFPSSIRATVFPYSEVCKATSNFNISKKVGQGSYGSVYHGNLRGFDVAIKQMKNTKSKEFFAELNVLCKVHHSNLVELIGYSAGAESLFLVYGFAVNGTLSDHLHNPSEKGHKPLPWHTRVEIAIDVAKGLEYIHSHVKPFCVHRDVKTSNILLDSNYRAKISDFGLVKLLEQSAEDGASASKIVGTFGYLSPEYVRDGCISPKCDVYAFGVVLMELITGQQALSKLPSDENGYAEHQSLVDQMLSTLESIQDRMNKLAHIVDSNLSHYHKESLFQMAMLSKECVNNYWKNRPSMSHVVLCLSHIAGSAVFAPEHY
ncbi:Non-specific serine/threonine protein kinase protein [Dioscorea alata]|uniref:Non-specific serine/threonine protein kinase protein n=1 Tax=Dioscorea alata TaxID=55571 RepID=A0ACB7W219_DIOAL|nr:Non-specific serine/threonine protein kinase protein [Dioscorea alata]